MILAEVPDYGGEVTVEVQGKGPRPKTAWVKALQGEPFTQITHGGPCQTSSAVALVSQLRNIRISMEDQPVPFSIHQSIER